MKIQLWVKCKNIKFFCLTFLRLFWFWGKTANGKQKILIWPVRQNMFGQVSAAGLAAIFSPNPKVSSKVIFVTVFWWKCFCYANVILSGNSKMLQIFFLSQRPFPQTTQKSGFVPRTLNWTEKKEVTVEKKTSEPNTTINLKLCPFRFCCGLPWVKENLQYIFWHIYYLAYLNRS